MFRAALHLLGLVVILAAFPLLEPKLRLICLPLAALAAVYLSVQPALRFLVSPLMSISGFLGRQNAGEFPCPACGYDVRATLTRCPECGTELQWGLPPDYDYRRANRRREGRYQIRARVSRR